MPYLVPGRAEAAVSRRSRPRRVAAPLGGASWVPARRSPRTDLRRLCRSFADDRRLVRFKFILLAGLLIAAAALERVV